MPIRGPDPTPIDNQPNIVCSFRRLPVRVRSPRLGIECHQMLLMNFFFEDVNRRKPRHNNGRTM